MAATIEVPASRPARRQHRRFPAPITVGVALVLAVTAALIVIAVWHRPRPASGPEPRSSCRTPRRDRPGADHQRRKAVRKRKGPSTGSQAVFFDRPRYLLAQRRRSRGLAGTRTQEIVMSRIRFHIRPALIVAGVAEEKPDHDRCDSLCPVWAGARGPRPEV